ncbi:MAG: histidine ammonia-lyase, partial [Phycisphaerales bacterium]
KAMRCVSLLRSVVAIELLVMAEAIEAHRPLQSGAGVEKAHATVRTRVAKLNRDRVPATDIRALEALVAAAAFAQA